MVWKNRLHALGIEDYPFAWQGKYQLHAKGSTVILETVVSQDLWIYHSMLCMASSHNDINVLQQSLLFPRFAKGHAPLVTYEINVHHYTKGYYLIDGIYPP
jgi:hypothetical protein